MVKGNSRQVIVVKPQAQLFEQAIFLLREDAVESGGVSPRELLEQAQDIADRYCAQGLRRRYPKLRRLLWALAGAALVGLAWLASIFLF